MDHHDRTPATADVVDAAPARLVVGLVRGLHGLRGALRVEVLTDDPARFEPGARLYPEGSDEPLTVDWAQSDGPGILVRFRERPDRVTAEPLRDSYLEAFVAADARPEGSWYWHEVTGAHVTASGGEDLGIVTDVFRAGGGEVFVVEGRRGEILVPAVGSVIVDFAPAEGRIVVDAEALALDDTEPRSRVRGRRTTRARKLLEQGRTPEAMTAADGKEAQPADRIGPSAGEVEPAAT